MAAYDSDSSGAEDVETGVTIGYASKEETGDSFSQLGGHPVCTILNRLIMESLMLLQSWLDELTPPSGDLAKCKVCNSLTSLLLQLNGDLPEQFSGHERRLYLFACRRKACRRKEGSIRGLRFTKINGNDASSNSTAPAKAKAAKKEPTTNSTSSEKSASGLGNTLFGIQNATSSSSSANPFGGSMSSNVNPFAAPSLAAISPQPPSVKESQSNEGISSHTTKDASLAQTFAQKASIAASKEDTSPAKPSEPWPAVSAFPEPYPSYYIDADKEYLDPEPDIISQKTMVADIEGEGEAGSSSAADDKTAFESTMDRTFQRFADRMAQNPEQVLRYDYGGQPLLYSKTDKIGKTWPRIPRCTKCGGERSFELQLTPHAIDELESEDISLEGMDWGTVILTTCKKDCAGWNEEWVAVQWEEIAAKK
ncbi:hypothetical protein MRB53_038539 [Persea americana]|nr:hypothetical protein MRB53_038539 [Persea americana]